MESGRVSQWCLAFAVGPGASGFEEVAAVASKVDGFSGVLVARRLA